MQVAAAVGPTRELGERRVDSEAELQRLGQRQPLGRLEARGVGHDEAEVLDDLPPGPPQTPPGQLELESSRGPALWRLATTPATNHGGGPAGR